MKDLKAHIVSQIGITFLDYPEPTLPSIIVYFLGCEHQCYLCHNPLFQTLNYNNKKIVTVSELYEEVKKHCEISKTSQVVLSGGDPLYPLHRDFIRTFVNKYQYVFKFCIYTGYDVEYVKKYDIKGFTFLKCGVYKFSQSQLPQKTNEFIQFASKNQVLYDKDFNVLSKDGRYYF